jgi:hypothetical protein
MGHVIYISLGLLLVILTCGCIMDQSPTGFGNGISILELRSELDSVYSGESVKVQAKIKNMGSFDADGDVSLSIGEWECNALGPTKFESMIAPSEEMGTEGEEIVVNWQCKAPQIDAGMQIPYEARAEVNYKYKSVTSKSVTLLPTSDLIALRDSGQPLPSELISRSHSPVEVEINVKGPIRVRSDTKSIEFPVNIVITNSGGGIVKDSKVDLDTEAISGLNVLSQDGCDYDDLHLFRGQSQTITCEMSAKNVETIVQARIVATLEYEYTEFETVGIEVVGSRAAFR